MQMYNIILDNEKKKFYKEIKKGKKDREWWGEDYFWMRKQQSQQHRDLENECQDLS